MNQKKLKNIIIVLLPLAFIATLVILFSDELAENGRTREVQSVKHGLDDNNDTEGDITVFLRVEGINESIYSGEINSPASGNPTALDKLTGALHQEGINYETGELNGNIMITSIDGEEAGTFGEDDGWLFMVNNEMTNVGAAEYQMEDNDELVFFYGGFPPATLIPQVEIEPSPAMVGENFKVTVTSTYTEHHTEEMVTTAIEGAAVYFEGREFFTDDEGRSEIRGVDYTGEYILQVRKEREDGFPALVRTGDSLKVKVVD